MALPSKVLPGFSAAMYAQTGATPTPLTLAGLSTLGSVQAIATSNYLMNIEKSLNEQVVLAGENDVKKPDKVFVKSDEIIVIDFKTGKINQKHMEQIVAYSKLMEEIFKKPVRCLLYYSALNQLTEL
jgi:ATP-dependent exoDNAse (exonuclease V) beta subunit